MLIAFFTALAATIAAQAAPGPNLLAVASVALNQGRGAAVMVATGVATGVWFWVVACTFGVAELFARFPASEGILQVIGGLYFLLIAFRVVSSMRSNEDERIRPAQAPMSFLAAYRRGLLVVMTNPKAAMMWVTITAFLYGAGLSTWEVFWIAPAGSLSALLIYGCYGYLFSTDTARSIYRRMARGFEFLFGMLFGLVGLRLLYEGTMSICRSTVQEYRLD